MIANSLLALALLVQQPSKAPALPPSSASSPSPTLQELEGLTRRVVDAVEAGRDSSERLLWLKKRPTDPERAAIVLGTLDRLTYRYSDAEREFQALERSPSASPPSRAYARLGLATLRVQQSRFGDAAPLLQQVSAEMSSPAAGAGRAHALMLLATVTLRRVSVDSARAVIRAAAAAVPPGDAWLRSLVDCNELVVRARAADPMVGSTARESSRRALAAGNRRAAAACLAALAQDFERRTLPDSSMAVFDEVAMLQRASRNYSSLAGTLQWQGFVLAASGNHVRARPLLDEAVRLAKQTEMLAAWAYAELGLANLALDFGDLSSAGRYARSASQVFSRSGDRGGLVSARQHEGDVALLGGSLGAARAAFEDVVRDTRSLFPTMSVHARGRLAAVALFEGDWPQAERELDMARAEAVRLDMPEWRQEDSYYRGLLALVRGRYDDAIAQLRSLERLLLPTDYGVRADVLTRLAEAHVRAGRPAPAESLLVLAGDLIDEWRRQLPGRELQAAVVGARSYDWDRDLGFATALSGLVSSGRETAAFRLAEQRRARLLLEGLARRQALAGRTDGAAHAVSISEADARRVIPDSTAVIAYLTGRGREPTTAFVLTRDTMTVATMAPVDAHAEEIARFIGLLAAGVDPTELARKLGDVFMQAALAQLPSGIHRLVIVADGPLHRIPFDALAPAGTLLMDRFVVSLAPSVAVAARWWSSAPREPKGRLLAFGDPVGVRLTGSNGDSTPPRLPVAAQEARAVARFASASDVFTGSGALESRIRNGSLTDVGVLHFATHAEVEEWSLLRSALLLAPGNGEDGRLTADELLDLEIGANLVVLSACRSGGGTVLAGEGLAGLTVPVLEAGAAAVVASLWQVGDQSIKPMIDLFYRELASGAPVADALQRARRTARARGVSPAVWATFTLTGDPRVHTALRAPSSTAPVYLVSAGLLAIGAFYVRARTRSRRRADRR